MSISITTFIMLVAICCAVSALMTEAIKAFCKNAGKNCPINLVALIDAFVVGGIGTAIAYVLLGIPFTLANILLILIMAVAIWIGSMIGYDKVMQLITQIGKGKISPIEETENEE